ncbi:MAG: hypothetical protein KME47_09735 [Nodosilinea sp. WJT8-NPBG4]|jgi:hypothetical protein|nr:hypothetical protein [Nodosilinea sp. WJT8-NPBG4]
MSNERMSIEEIVQHNDAIMQKIRKLIDQYAQAIDNELLDEARRIMAEKRSLEKELIR